RLPGTILPKSLIAFTSRSDDDSVKKSLVICSRRWANPHGLLPQRNLKIPPYPPLVKGGWGDFHIKGVIMRKKLVIIGGVWDVIHIAAQTLKKNI
ncbi:MAG: hypothetical protein Q7I93_01740, partial [Syntrophales bacterium]|nr:hypothetical protein [Syntrophales bacterium]